MATATRSSSSKHPPTLTSSAFCFRYSTREAKSGKGEAPRRRRGQSFSFNEVELVEPKSPKVGCMGQIKKEKMGAAASHVSSNKFLKLFSGKGLGFDTSKAPGRRLMLTSGSEKVSGVVSPVEPPLELDPPLPVKKVREVGDGAVNLWKRRGVSLEGLEMHKLPPPRWNYKDGCSA